MFPAAKNIRHRPTSRAVFGVAAALLLLTACAAPQQQAVEQSVQTQKAGNDSAAPQQTTKSAADTGTDTAAPQPEQQPHNGYDIDSPDSITVVVNKARPLTPLDYEPQDLVQPELVNLLGQPLRREASEAATAMYHAARAATGSGFAICSGYRSYDYQKQVYAGYVAQSGQAAADKFSARPGHSEHQTGLAIDIVAEGSECRFDDHLYVTPTGQWMSENAWRYGFILRYDNGLEPIVGYQTEQWHWRYVGKEVAAQMQQRQIKTLEEFFGTGPAPEYLN